MLSFSVNFFNRLFTAELVRSKHSTAAETMMTLTMQEPTGTHLCWKFVATSIAIFLTTHWTNGSKTISCQARFGNFNNTITHLFTVDVIIQKQLSYHRHCSSSPKEMTSGIIQIWHQDTSFSKTLLFIFQNNRPEMLSAPLCYLLQLSVWVYCKLCI